MNMYLYVPVGPIELKYRYCQRENFFAVSIDTTHYYITSKQRYLVLEIQQLYKTRKMGYFYKCRFIAENRGVKLVNEQVEFLYCMTFAFHPYTLQELEVIATFSVILRGREREK